MMITPQNPHQEGHSHTDGETHKPCEVCGILIPNEPTTKYCRDCSALVHAVRLRYGYKTRTPAGRKAAFEKVLDLRFGTTERETHVERTYRRVSAKYGFSTEEDHLIEGVDRPNEVESTGVILPVTEQILAGVTEDLYSEPVTPERVVVAPTPPEEHPMTALFERVKNLFTSETTDEEHRSGPRITKSGKLDKRYNRKPYSELKCSGKYKYHKWKETYTLPNGRTEERTRQTCMRCGAHRESED